MNCEILLKQICRPSYLVEKVLHEQGDFVHQREKIPKFSF